MKRTLEIAIVILCLLTAGYAAAASGWERLGARDVEFRGDRDTIDVGRHEGRFKQLQIRVKGAPIEIDDMVVTFGNDEKFHPKVAYRFPEGSGSRTIDLPGDRRSIKRIDFRYRSVSKREGKGRVEVYAR
ncbi:MAG TPA: hypothetical protein VJQ55_04445 [Candidatus Binatia bacterium]|nr:hypothetical protein [Candidatus Binatia bacterium]